MKKLKLHKTFLGAFTIWSANRLCGPFRTYFAAIMMFLVIVMLSGCASNQYSHSKARKRADKMTNPQQRQYAFVNNQIIIFENNH